MKTYPVLRKSMNTVRFRNMQYMTCLTNLP